MKDVPTPKFNQTAACLFIAYIVRIILITVVVLYQICGLFVALGGP